MEITEETKKLVPADIDGKLIFTKNKKQKTIYVYVRQGYTYEAKKGRTKDLRAPVGSIRDGKFKYSPSFLKNREIAQLKATVQNPASDKAAQPPAELENKEAVEHISNAVSAVEDCRQKGKVKFPLDIVLAVSILASLAGYTGAVSIANYWKLFHKELAELFPDFPEENISHDTVNRIFRLIDPQHFMELMTLLAKPLMICLASRYIHIDGQAVTASKTPHLDGGRYIFSAYDSKNGLTVSQRLINEKKNEISTAIELLEQFKLMPGDIVTADAMNTQRKLVEYLCSKGVGYCLAVKENQSTLMSEIRHLFNHADSCRAKKHESNDCDHGRIENRDVTVLPGRLLSKSLLQLWPGLQDGSLIRVVNNTVGKSKRSRTSREVRYFISSVNHSHDGSEKNLADVVRKHWSIENCLHWVLDVQFNQDRIQCTDCNYLSNRVALNKISLNTLRATQKILQKRDNKKYSIATLQQLCATPASGLETVACALEAKDWLSEENVQS